MPMFFLINKNSLFSLNFGIAIADNSFRGRYIILANNIRQSETDRQKALELLGREPRTPFIIKTRCADGSPQVLLADPVFKEDNIWKPFPTFLWLVCPELKLKAAHLEQEGLVKHYSERLQTDSVFRAEFEKGQKEISKIRIEMAHQILGEDIPEHIVEILTETTIAGSRNIAGVKCLHAHLAQELAFGNNPIGKDVLVQVGNCQGNHERIKQ
ncbi:MAG: uncharacterized protein PWR01_3297 [Clostridiales bacterium]|jgi:hypothetical protein|nr:uncharacterized protein [Clostridiales bacterium]MDN5282224.1 uncharacterized protein [Candidatus Ozemobacter sp.]